VALGHTDCVTAVVGLKHLSELDLLLEAAVGEFNLLGNSSTVNLNLHDVSLVLAELQKTDLGGNDYTHN